MSPAYSNGNDDTEGTITPSDIAASTASNEARSGGAHDSGSKSLNIKSDGNNDKLSHSMSELQTRKRPRMNELKKFSQCKAL